MRHGLSLIFEARAGIEPTLDCRVCGLELDGEAELEAAGMPAMWELDSDEVNPSDSHAHDDDYE